MKTLILLITLTCGCITATFAQINQKHKRDMTADKLTMSYKMDQFLGYNDLNRPHHIYEEKVLGSLLPYSNKLKSSPAKTSVLSNMPCHKPLGVFSMRIVKPDTTTLYTMLIK